MLENIFQHSRSSLCVSMTSLLGAHRRLTHSHPNRHTAKLEWLHGPCNRPIAKERSPLFLNVPHNQLLYVQSHPDLHNSTTHCTIANTSAPANVHPPGGTVWRSSAARERKARLGPSPKALAKLHFLLLFILVSGGNNGCLRQPGTGSPGEQRPASSRWSVWTRLTMGSTWPAFLNGADPRSASSPPRPSP